MGNLNIPRHNIPTPQQAYDEMLGVKNQPNKNDIVEISIDKLLQYSKHPFQIKEKKVLELIDSIDEQGILMPLLVRPHPSQVGYYEMLAGHHRCEASKKLNLNSLPCIVKTVDDDTAALIVVESNRQRGFSDMLPSEIAKALKLEYDALKSQGKRNDLMTELDEIMQEQNACKCDNSGQNENLCPVGTKLDSGLNIANKNEMSRREVYRYIRLNSLIPTLLDLVDEDKIAIRPAVDLSFLKESEQFSVVEVLDTSYYRVDMKKAEKLKEYSRENKLNADTVRLIISGEVFNIKEKKITSVKLPVKNIKSYMPTSLSFDKYEEYIVKALEFYKENGEINNE